MKLRSGIVAAAVAVALAVGGIAAAIDGDGSDDDADAGNVPTATEGSSQEAYIGLSLSDAVELANSEDRDWRVSRTDDEVKVLTDDLVPGRVTFEVDDGIVTSAMFEEANVPSPDEAAPEDPARADLLAAAIRRLVTVDNSFGGRDVFDDIRVATVLGGDPARPLQALDLEVIAAAIGDLGDVTLIDDARAEIDSLFDESQAGVAVVAVDDILLLDDRAEVKLSLWCGSLCGVFLTYAAVPDGTGWNITGTTGPIAIS